MNKDNERFAPHPLLRSGHLQTLAGTFLRRKFALPVPEERLFRVDTETQLKGLCHWQPGKAKEAPVMVIVHGLEGSCDSNYVRGIADKAYALGFHAIRMNQRNCGGTERLTPTLYNSGLSADYRAVLMELIAEGYSGVFFAGYSMGGNLVTKMAGELGHQFGQGTPKELLGVAAVCPSLDLGACADALERAGNFLYQRHFVSGLMTRYQRKAEMFPARYVKDGFGKIATVREFDDAITAPQFGFKDAEDYYEASGAKKVIRRVAVPLLLITAQDDPFVPYESFKRIGIEDNAKVRFLAPEHGGHCGFVSRNVGVERFWAEQRIVEFAQQLRLARQTR
jgi:predicted alpha/beta-fold hydrolase